MASTVAVFVFAIVLGAHVSTSQRPALVGLLRKFDCPRHRVSGAPGASRRTSLAGLSSRNPTKTVCRNRPSAQVR
jgi:hypothetical protein